MNKFLHVLKCERGFMLLNVVFLTLITAFAAMILLNAAPRVKNSQATLRLTAIYLANEQFAQLESMAASGVSIGGSYNFLGVPDDLISNNLGEKNPVEFIVVADVSGDGNLRTAKVTVKIKGDENFKLVAERTIRIATQQT